MTGRLRGTTIAVFAMLASMLTVGTAAATGTDFSVSPMSGPVGTSVVIDAAGATTFPTPADPTAIPTVAFNGVASTAVTVNGTTELTAVVPATATTGPVTVVVGTTTYSGPTFTVETPASPEQPAWTVTLSRPSIVYGGATTVTGVLSGAAGAVKGATAQLQAQPAGSANWAPVAGAATARTNAAGIVSWRVSPRQNEEYRISSSATMTDLAALSSSVAARVTPRLTLDPLSVAPVDETSHLTGTVRPAIAGTIALQRLTGSSWHRVARTGAARGRLSFPITPTSSGVQLYRVVEPANALHGSATSRTVQVEATRGELRYGSSGPDVLALQSRLRQLNYDVGPPSASYGWDMVHAVTAFEKVQGIGRDGVAGDALWRRLGNPRAPHLEHPYVNAPVAVEVNLTSQILMIAKYGKVWRILDTSTAGGYTYTDSAGFAATAITPTGRFTIRYKVDHLVTDKLGSLWRPSYFDYSGDAIHGEGDGNSGGDVPPYAASHGCVRITDLAVNRYYDLFAVGTPVWIYH